MEREITPWSPWRDMISMRDSLDRLFDESLTSMARPADFQYPAINVHQNDKEVIVEADVPGMKEEEIDIEIGDNAVIIKGERKRESDVKKENYYHREVHYGSFSRGVSLPIEIDSSKATAKLEHGTLVITLPKKAIKVPKTVKIKPKATR